MNKSFSFTLIFYHPDFLLLLRVQAQLWNTQHLAFNTKTQLSTYLHLSSRFPLTCILDVRIRGFSQSQSLNNRLHQLDPPIQPVQIFLLVFKNSFCSNLASPCRFLLGVNMSLPALKSLSIGALEGSAVLYFMNSFVDASTRVSTWVFWDSLGFS